MTIEETQLMLPVGTLLSNGNYRVVRYIASGGFGNTYEVEDVMLGHSYAMKEFFMRGVNTREGTMVTVGQSITSDVRDVSDKMRQKFLQEAQHLARLDNSHIVPVIRLFEENQTVYYVMKMLNGTSLNKLIEANGPLPESKVRDVLSQVLNALDYVHRQDLYHLDLKPANLMMDGEGHVTLIDFGASKQLSAEDGHTLTTTALPYTPGYAPTEQVTQSKKNIGAWTDFYALGATLYTLLTAQTPPSVADIVNDGAAAFTFPASVSPQKQELIVWMMQPSRNQRPQNVAQILDRLGEAPTTTPTSVPTKVPPVSTPTKVVTKNNNTVVGPKGHDTVVATPSKPSRRLWPWLAGAAAVAAVIIGLLLFSGKDTKPVYAEDAEGEKASEAIADSEKVVYGEVPPATDIIPAEDTSLIQTPTQPEPATLAESPNEPTQEAAEETPDPSPQPTQICPDSNHPHMIDLGLPSGTKWACCNVGASKPEDYGGYYSWGETSTKNTFYTWSVYKWCNGEIDKMTKYNTSEFTGSVVDNITQLELSDDVAHTAWGGSWRMPTVTQCNELINNATHEWTTINGVAGAKVTGPSGNYIFLPAAGWRGGEVGPAGANSYCSYWTSTLYESMADNAWYLNLDFTRFRTEKWARNDGMTVRPVRRN